MELSEARQHIDNIDDLLADLYVKRMEIVREIGESKKSDGISVENVLREKEIINRVTKNISNDVKPYAKQVFDTLFNTSKAYQSQIVTIPSPTRALIDSAVGSGKVSFPVSATIACQGVVGAYAQIAADKLFPISNILYMKDWNSVFCAVENGLCEFGVLPIENSSVGSVNAVYDLLCKHNCYIVRSIKLHIQHFMLAKAGVKACDVKEIYSHQQALDQCAEYIKTLKNVKITVCDNTAQAAKFVAESPRVDIACISSRECAGIYGLSILAPNIQDNSNNYTRFIAISKTLTIFNGANKISIMVNLPNETGSLNQMLTRFSTLGLNLTKLESRPISNTSFEFAFYFDFDADIERVEVRNLIANLDNVCDRFVFLGSYSEIA